MFSFHPGRWWTWEPGAPGFEIHFFCLVLPDPGQVLSLAGPPFLVWEGDNDIWRRRWGGLKRKYDTTGLQQIWAILLPLPPASVGGGDWTDCITVQKHSAPLSSGAPHPSVLLDRTGRVTLTNVSRRAVWQLWTEALTSWACFPHSYPSVRRSAAFQKDAAPLGWTHS